MANQFLTMRVGGEREVIGVLDEFTIEKFNKVHDVVEESVTNIQMAAVNAVAVSSGKLISSISKEVKRSGGSIIGRVRSRARYSLYQELGTGLVGENTFKGARPAWHKYQQPALKEQVYTKYGWAYRSTRWRAGWGGRNGTQKRYVTGSLIQEQTGKHDPPPIGKIKAWASLHGLNPYAVRTMIYRRQGIPPHPFLFPADKAEQPKFEQKLMEALGE